MNGLRLLSAVSLALALVGCQRPTSETPFLMPENGPEVAAVLEHCGGERHVDAVQAFDDFVAANPGNADALAARASCAFAESMASDDLSDNDDAIADYTRAIALVEGGEPSIFGLDGLLQSRSLSYAMKAMADSNWAPVVHDLDRAIALRPTARRHVDRAMAYVGLRDGQRAAADLAYARTLAAGDPALLGEIEGLEADPETAALLASDG